MSALNWQKPPLRTEWGSGMVEALIEVDRDHTLRVFCEEEAKDKAELLFDLSKRPLLRALAYQAIDQERNYQDAKWGTIPNHPHEVGGWLTIMRKLLTDAEAAWAGSRGDTGALEEIRKVIATGIACAEQHGLPRRFP